MFFESPHRELAGGRMERDSDDVIAPSPYRRSMRLVWRGIELNIVRVAPGSVCIQRIPFTGEF